jgi:hypothetical protein
MTSTLPTAAARVLADARATLSSRQVVPRATAAVCHKSVTVGRKFSHA